MPHYLFVLGVLFASSSGFAQSLDVPRSDDEKCTVLFHALLAEAGTPLNQLAGVLGKIDVDVVFNSCRLIGNCRPEIGMERKTVFSLGSEDLDLTAADIRPLLLDARMARDLTDTIVVRDAFIVGDGTTFRQQYQARHLSRRQRRFRLDKTEIAEGASQKEILQKIQAKEQKFTQLMLLAARDYRQAMDSVADENLAEIVSSYLASTGIPNRVVRNGDEFEVEIPAIPETEWKLSQSKFEDGVSDPAFSPQYPELLQFVQVADRQGYRVRLEMKMFSDHPRDNPYDEEGGMYYLDDTDVFSEFYHKRQLATQGFADFRIIPLLKGYLKRLQWLVRLKPHVPPQVFNFYSEPVATQAGRMIEVGKKHADETLPEALVEQEKVSGQIQALIRKL